MTMGLKVDQLERGRTYRDTLTGATVRVTYFFGQRARGLYYWNDRRGEPVGMDIHDGDLEDLPARVTVMGFRSTVNEV
jgi:hypothetical protein